MQFRLSTDVWAKYASLATFDPVTMTMVGLAAVGGGLSAAGTLAGGANSAAMGRAAGAEATFESQQAKINAGSDVAAAQRKMFQTQEKTNLLTGTATARGAASGINVGEGSAAENIGEIGHRGRYAAALDLWNGQNAASADLNKAAALDYQSKIDILGGDAAQKASYFTAGGQFFSTIAGAGATAFKNFNPAPAAPPGG